MTMGEIADTIIADPFETFRDSPQTLRAQRIPKIVVEKTQASRSTTAAIVARLKMFLAFYIFFQIMGFVASARPPTTNGGNGLRNIVYMTG